MKITFLKWVLLCLVLAVACPVARRWRVESRNKTIAVMVDWPEIRELTARESWNTFDLLKRLKEHDVTGVLAAPLSVSDLVSLHKVVPLNATSDPLDVLALRFSLTEEAHAVMKQLKENGVRDLTLDTDGVTLRRSAQSFSAVRDVEAEFDPELERDASAVGLRMMRRVNRDPWAPAEDVVNDLREAAPAPTAVLFNSDEPPGGTETSAFWKSWILHQGVTLPFFEFHPSKAAAQMAYLCAANVYRAHTIPSLELKDMSPEQERSRWRRAIQERACRFLLVHASPNDSTADYFARLDRLHGDLSAHAWHLGIPRFRVDWPTSGGIFTSITSWLALLVAIVWPCWGLWLARSEKNALEGFIWLCFMTVLGGTIASTLAFNQWTRLEILPFRGIKVAFLATWAGSILILYRYDELKEMLRKVLRRSDVVIGVLVLSLVAYAMIRSGNASAAWKNPWEQSLRDHLEEWLWVRPRFKEFAFGHPLMLLGLWLGIPSTTKRTPWDGRPWIALGMVGQASIMNTFCHLHSPIELAYGRSLVGIAFGAILGGILIRLVSTPLQRLRS